MTKKGALLFAAMCAIWGVPYLLIKVAVEALSPATLVLARTGVAAIILLPLAARRGALRPLLPHWKPLVAYTVIELAVPWLLLSSAEKRVTSSLAALLIASVPMVGAVVSRLAGDAERLNGRRIAGLLIGLAGVVALVGLDTSSADPRALVEIAVVAVGYAVGPRFLAHQLKDCPGLGVVAASLALTALAYLPLGLVQAPSTMPAAKVVWAVLGLATLCTALAFVVFFALITEIGPVRATVITYVNPAVAVALGALVLGESITTATGVGFILILAGSVLATARSKAPVATVDAVPAAAAA